MFWISPRTSRPSPVSRYSTQGGTVGYTLRVSRPSRSSAQADIDAIRTAREEFDERTARRPPRAAF